MQFCVYRLDGGSLVLDLQSDLIDTGSRIVAPLLPAGEYHRNSAVLEPIFQIGETEYLMFSTAIAAVPSGMLSGTPVANLTAQDYAIRRALDMLFSGF